MKFSKFKTKCKKSARFREAMHEDIFQRKVVSKRIFNEEWVLSGHRRFNHLRLDNDWPILLKGECY